MYLLQVYRSFTIRKLIAAKKILRCFQGVAFVTLCFFSLAANAGSACYANDGYAAYRCEVNSGSSCGASAETTSSFCHGAAGFATGSTLLTYYFGGGDYYYSSPIAPFNHPAYREITDYDENNCFNGAGGIEYCPDDPLWEDTNGYTNEGCLGILCPGDPGWADAEGYDADGFDSGGVDRGGNNAAAGGGYSGTASSGGTPPDYLESEPPLLPEALDPQNGDNANSEGTLYCGDAYPGYLEVINSGIYEYDAIACVNDCQYQYSGTSFDVVANTNILDYFPTGVPCNGEEPAISIDIGQYIPDSDCFEFGALVHCVDSQTQEKTCYTNDNGSLGYVVQCPADQSDTTIVDNNCGTANGIYQCFSSSDPCEFYAGYLVCIDSNTGLVISDTSPDHPVNGGNADGITTNDLQGDNPDINLQPTTQERIDEERLAAAIYTGVDQLLRGDFASLENVIGGGLSSIDQEIGQQTSLLDSRLVEQTGFLSNIQNALDNGPDDDFDFDNLTEGSFDTDSLDTKINDRKQELLDLIDQLELQAEAAVAFAPTEEGALPCPSVEIFATDFELCISDYEPQLSPIGDFLLFMSYAMGFFVFTKR